MQLLCCKMVSLQWQRSSITQGVRFASQVTIGNRKMWWKYGNGEHFYFIKDFFQKVRLGCFNWLGCHNKITQTTGLINTNLLFIALEIGKSKIKVWDDLILARASSWCANSSCLMCPCLAERAPLSHGSSLKGIDLGRGF